MEIAALIDAVDDNGTRLFTAAAAGLDAPVTACPGWDVAHLVVHTGQVHGWIAGAIEANSTERPTHRFPEAPDGDVIAWGREQHQYLLEVLRTTDPARPAWTWGAEQTVGWFHRRMAHETLVHRWDAEAAVGAITDIDSDLATDGVDELLHVGMQTSTNPKKEFSYPEGSLHLHRTDGDGEWMVRADNGALVVTHEHAKGDVAVRASGPDLLLYLWGRSREGLEIFGDEALADAWAAVAP